MEFPLSVMEHSAMPRTSRPIQPGPPDVDRLLVGRHDEDDTYRIVRTTGTSDWLLLYTVAGRGRIRIDGWPDTVAGPGSITVITPGTPHDYGTDRDGKRWTMIWAHVHPRLEWLPLLEWPETAPGVRLLELPDVVDTRVGAAFAKASSLGRSGMRHAIRFGMNAMEEALLWCDTQNPHGDQVDPRVLVVLDHVGNHLDQPHTVRSLAQVAGLSPSRLSHLFVTQLGISVMAHIERHRMELARDLLDVSSLPIAEVARRVGYTDPLYFSRRFRQAAGCAPTTYRERRRTGASTP